MGPPPPELEMSGIMAKLIKIKSAIIIKTDLLVSVLLKSKRIGLVKLLLVSN